MKKVVLKRNEKRIELNWLNFLFSLDIECKQHHHPAPQMKLYMIFAQGPITVMLCCCYLCQRECGSERNDIKYSKAPWRPESSTALLWTCNCKYCYCNFFQNCQGSLWFMMMAYGNAGSARLITAVSNRNLPGGHLLEKRVNCMQGLWIAFTYNNLKSGK